ncbi:hypothetical protein D3C77_481850 [compost metagenome]
MALHRLFDWVHGNPARDRQRMTVKSGGNLGMRQFASADLALQIQRRRSGQVYKAPVPFAGRLGSISQHRVVVVRKSIKLVYNDEVKSLIKTHQLMSRRQVQPSVLPALGTAAVENSRRFVGKSFGNSRRKLQHNVPSRRRNQHFPSAVKNILDERKDHLRLSRPRHGPQ